MTFTGVLVAGAFAGAVEQVRKMWKRHRKDEKTVRGIEENECNKFDDMTEASQVLSCIVEGVYLRCKPAQKEKGLYFQSIDQHWTHWGYKDVDFGNLDGTYDQVTKDRFLVGDLGQSKDQCVRLVLFERSNSHEASRCVRMRVEGTLDQLIPVELPKYLLAIRGTILSQPEDIKNDIKIVGEVLHLSEELHKPVKRLLRAIIHKNKPHDIWVVGHSLGAALALYATRSLAIKENIVINPHLFNLPYATVGRLANKAMQGLLNGVGDIGNRFLHVLGMEETCNIRAGIDKVHNKCKNQVRKSSRMVLGITNSPYAEKMKKESQKLLEIGYVPHLYVNPKDTICNEYIQHFQRSDNHVYTSIVSEVMQGVVPGKSVHKIPSAVLYINNWGEGPREAHRLLQWFRYPHVNLTVERKRLTTDQISPTPSKFTGSSQAQD